jgi:hypothetical protein
MALSDGYDRDPNMALKWRQRHLKAIAKIFPGKALDESMVPECHNALD